MHVDGSLSLWMVERPTTDTRTEAVVSVESRCVYGRVSTAVDRRKRDVFSGFGSRRRGRPWISYP